MGKTVFNFKFNELEERKKIRKVTAKPIKVFDDKKKKVLKKRNKKIDDEYYY